MYDTPEISIPPEGRKKIGDKEMHAMQELHH
jgi:hypothetical protein